MAGELRPEHRMEESIAQSAAAIEQTILDEKAHLEARREFVAANPEFARVASLMAARIADNETLSRKDLFLTGVELRFLFERHQNAASELMRLFGINALEQTEATTQPVKAA